MALFGTRNIGKSQDAKIAKKSKTATKVTTPTRGGNGLIGRIEEIRTMVERNLGKYADETLLITTADGLHDYISQAIVNGVIAIDTETNGLDPILDDIVGLCIYTPGLKTAYVPINHVSYITNAHVPNQMPRDVVKSELERILDANVKVIMFNAKFDIRVIRHHIGVYLKCYWDCYLGARLLNENEPSNQLKILHQKYVLNGKGDAFTFDALFNGIRFSLIPVKTAYLYAAHDAIITHEYFKYQEQFLDPTQEECKKRGLEDVAWVFRNVEMPCVEVCCDMEDNGVLFDNNYATELSIKYGAKKDAILDEINSIIDGYSSAIITYKTLNPNHKLENPVNIASPSQLATLLYDVLKIEPPNPKNPRGTGVDILKEIDIPLAKKILEYREVDKLLSTYIDKLPKCVNPKDGRIHCSFNQYGADTGRMSSNNPNLQNIPSHNHDIRKMFVASQSESYVESSDNSIVVSRWCEVDTSDGWVYADKVKVGDQLCVLDDNGKNNLISISTIVVDKNHITYYYTTMV